jgi:hypothetical protein
MHRALSWQTSSARINSIFFLDKEGGVGATARRDSWSYTLCTKPTHWNEFGGVSSCFLLFPPHVSHVEYSWFDFGTEKNHLAADACWLGQLYIARVPMLNGLKEIWIHLIGEDSDMCRKATRYIFLIWFWNTKRTCSRWCMLVESTSYCTSSNMQINLRKYWFIWSKKNRICAESQRWIWVRPWVLMCVWAWLYALTWVWARPCVNVSVSAVVSADVSLSMGVPTMMWRQEHCFGHTPWRWPRQQLAYYQ